MQAVHDDKQQIQFVPPCSAKVLKMLHTPFNSGQDEMQNCYVGVQCLKFVFSMHWAVNTGKD